MLGQVDAEHVELVTVPTADDIETEPALAYVIGRYHLFSGDHWIEERDVSSPEGHYIAGAGQYPRRPGQRFEVRRVVVGDAAVALPTTKGQHEIETGLVGHDGGFLVVLPTGVPAFGHGGDGKSA